MADSIYDTLRITSEYDLDPTINTIKENSTDPKTPLDGTSVIWLTDGTNTGSDGDILTKTTTNNVVNTTDFIAETNYVYSVSTATIVNYNNTNTVNALSVIIPPGTWLLNYAMELSDAGGGAGGACIVRTPGVDVSCDEGENSTFTRNTIEGSRTPANHGGGPAPVAADCIYTNSSNSSETLHLVVYYNTSYTGAAMNLGITSGVDYTDALDSDITIVAYRISPPENNYIFNMGNWELTDGTNSQVIDLSYALFKINGFVFLDTEFVDQTSGISGTIIETAGIPSEYRPSSTVFAPILIRNNTTVQIGTIKIDTSGNVEFLESISATSGSWTTRFTCWGAMIQWHTDI